MKQTFLKRSLLFSTTLAAIALGASAHTPERGYRGFVDWTNRIERSTFADVTQTYYSPGISTSHGYQFNPWLFAGAGIDYTVKDTGRWYKDDHLEYHSYHLDNYFLSIFGQVRTDLKFGKFTPFGDLRIGWNACENGTVYFSPTIGYRFNWGRKIGVNAGIGYTLDSFRYEKHIPGYTVDGYMTYIPTGEHYNWNQSSFTFRIGIDF